MIFTDSPSHQVHNYTCISVCNPFTDLRRSEDLLKMSINQEKNIQDITLNVCKP